MDELRRNIELPFPDFDDTTRAELKDRLDFPTTGSVGRR